MSDQVPDDVAGFPDCPKCPYFATGWAGLCATCAAQTLPPLAEHSCPICSQQLPSPDAACGNRLCSSSDRQFTSARAIAMKRYPLERVIWNYKYTPGYEWWASIFGRLLVGHLRSHPSPGRLIVPVPSFVGEGSTTLFHHTEEVLRRAADEDLFGDLTFDAMDDPTLVLTGPKPSSAKAQKSYSSALETAQRLRELLQVRHPERVEGRGVTVYDDVFTTGHTVNEVARALRQVGASDVDAVVLSRQPWGQM